jgi:undecaprenyl-diphosphatase
MLGQSILWGLIQGLTEFLPISSSGHLVLVPELLGQDPPDLATSALLHIGTLVAVLVYFRRDLADIFRRTAEGKRLARFVIIGTIPAAVIGLAFPGPLDDLQQNSRAVAVALFVTGLILLASTRIDSGTRTPGGTVRDSVVMGVGQAFALIPGISRSGASIAAGFTQGIEKAEAARLSFILGIPAIAGAGALQFADLSSSDSGIDPTIWVGVAVAAVSGYAAIAALLNVLRRTGLGPFGYYCVVAGVVAFALV